MKQFLKSILLVLSHDEKVKLIKLTLSDVVIALLDIAFLGLLLVIVNFYTPGSATHASAFFSNLFVNNNSLLLTSIFLALFALKNYLGFLVQSSQHHFFYDVASRLSKRNMQRYLAGGYDNYVQIDSSVHTRKISQQPVEFSHYILTNFQQVVSQSMLILFTVVAIIIYHPVLFVLLFLLLLPPVFILGWYLRNKMKALRSQIKTSGEKTIQHLNESLAGYVESNLYGKNDFFTERYYSYQQQLNNSISAQQTWQSLPSRLIEVFAVLGFFILVVVNKLTSHSPAISVLTIGIFMAAAYKIIPGIVKLLNSTGQMKTYEFIMNDLIDSDPIRAKPAMEASETINAIRFDKVSFGYKDNPVLNALSFEIAPGDMVGISAHSGAGKTTIINLLLGFLQPVSGTISINYQTADNAVLLHYRKNVSLVKQQPFFIHDTILKNITLAHDAHDEVKLSKALCYCGLQPLLSQYPEGINKVINENGKNISGGQRQRIVLARALYHDFDLLILDEPFSEMDAEAESMILIKLQQLAEQGKMILLITHNKASLAYCNKIILPHG